MTAAPFLTAATTVAPTPHPRAPNTTIPTRRAPFLLFRFAIILAFATLSGCAHSSYFPDVPSAQRATPAGTQFAYDVGSTGNADYVQTFRGPRKRMFHFRPADLHGEILEVDWDQIDVRKETQLFILLDGVPYDALDELWSEGYFRLFHPPGLVVSTFPSLTDVAFSYLLDSDVPPGYEASYFDRTKNHLSNGTDTYLKGDNEPWSSACDYRISFIEDAIMYLFPSFVFRRELESARRTFARNTQDAVVIYLLSTDGLGHTRKRSELLYYLKTLDRWIERAVYDRQGRLQVTVISDHGNSFVPTKPARLDQTLQRAGLRIVKSLQRPNDVVLPEFGLIDFAALYTYDHETLDEVVNVCRTAPGVELVMFRDRDTQDILVLRGPQSARIRRSQDGSEYTYAPENGDPLELLPLMRNPGTNETLNENGLAQSRTWLAATHNHKFPDPLYRIFQAFDENTQNPADILLSLKPGWHAGDPALDAWVKMEGTHGGLRAASSNGLIMSTAFESPPFSRPVEILDHIRQHVPWQPRVEKSAQGSSPKNQVCAQTCR